MWILSPLPDVQKRLDKYKKKWSREMTNVFDNLDTLLEALNCGTNPEQLKQLGFVHSEPFGILAIDQKGPGKGAKLKPFRLYTYPDEEAKRLDLIILGDKDTQQDDIRESKAFVQELWQRKKRAEHGKAKDGDRTTKATEDGGKGNVP
jgi:hypothetical protein